MSCRGCGVRGRSSSEETGRGRGAVSGIPGDPGAPGGRGRRRRHRTPEEVAFPGLAAGALPLAAALLSTFLAAFLSNCGGTGPPPPARIGPAPEYADLAADLGDFIADEMEAKRIAGLALALTDGDRIVWAEGFGEARPGVPADADTPFRVGSVSKLFTDLAVVALHERGALDLDAPIGDSLPGFAPAPGPEDPADPITLRQLMAHRAGLVREPPVGHYFDDSSPSLRETVASLNRVPLVFPPGARLKYSNAGIAVVGRVLEVAAGKPFAEAVTETALAPLGLDSSSFDLAAAPAERLASATMWSYDGREFPAPTFPLGMAPAGSLVTSVRDLGRFLTLLAGGDLPGVVSADGLREMWRVQFPEETGGEGPEAAGGVSTGFGLGFHLAALESGAGDTPDDTPTDTPDDGSSPEPRLRLVGHGGAIYGFSTELAFLPEAGLGAVAVANVDFTNAVVGRIVRETLRSALARRAGRPRSPRRPEPLPAGLAARLHGLYETDAGGRLRVLARGERAEMEIGSGTLELAQAAPGVLIADSRLAHGPRIEIGEPDDGRIPSLRLLGETYRRVPDPLPAAAPEEFLPLLGEYGWDHNLLFVFERDGALTVLIEWLARYALTPSPAAPDCFDFPDAGLYPGESLCFLRDEAGGVTGADLSGIVFPRRPGPGDAEGGTFRIEPLLPVAELRARAEAASPPAESGDFRDDDLVRLTDLDPGIRLEVRYASENNFMGTAFYEVADAFLQRPAAEALARANAALAEHGYAALVYDGYRPWRVTKMFYDATPEHQRLFVADPADGSRHNRGAAVDLGLVDRATGEVLEFVSGYDEFSERAFPSYVGGTSRQRWRRELLRRVMEREGFTVYEHEWWHFDYRDWQRYRLLEVPLAEIGSDGR